jgi:hypothetical protein
MEASKDPKGGNLRSRRIKARNQMQKIRHKMTLKAMMTAINSLIAVVFVVGPRTTGLVLARLNDT